MSTRRALVILVAALLVLPFSGCSRTTRTFEVELTQEDLQRRIEPKFPIERKAYLTQVRVEDPVVRLRPDRDDLAIALKLTVDPPGFEARTGRLELAGKLEYRQPDKAFYISEPAIEVLELDGVPPELHRKVKDAVETIARGALTAIPVYRFEQRSAVEVTAEHLLETVAVREGRLVATMRLPL